MTDRLLNITQAADYLGVSKDALRKWDKSGKLKPFKTSGGHRRYSVIELDKFVGKNAENSEEKNKNEIILDSISYTEAAAALERVAIERNLSSEEQTLCIQLAKHLRELNN